MTSRLFFILTLLIFYPSPNLFGARGCRCLCSLFYTRGGEKKLCAIEKTTKIKCDDWYHDLPEVADKAKCLNLGESLNECKGNFKENTKNADWTLIEGARYHSCRFG